MSAKKSKSQLKYEQSMREMQRGIPVEKSKAKKPFRKKLMGVFAGAAMVLGFNAYNSDDNSNTQNQAEPTPVVQQSRSPVPSDVFQDPRIAAPLYDVNLNHSFNQSAHRDGQWQWSSVTDQYEYRDQGTNRPSNSTNDLDIWLGPPGGF